MKKTLGIIGMSLVLTGCATTNAQVVPAPPDTEPEYSTQESVIISGEEYESPEQSLVEAEKAPTPEPTPEPVPEPTPEVTEEPPAEETPVPEEPVSEDNEDTQSTPQEDTPQASRSGERSIPIPVSEVKKYAYEQIVNKYKWDESEFTCVENLWERESNWKHTAENPSSGAYGIPQSLPGNKMASAGSDWRTNPRTQIDWGLEYIEGRYTTPCGAWAHSERRGWY